MPKDFYLIKECREYGTEKVEWLRLIRQKQNKTVRFFLFAAALFLIYTSASLWVLGRINARYSLGVKRSSTS